MWNECPGMEDGGRRLTAQTALRRAKMGTSGTICADLGVFYMKKALSVLAYLLACVTLVLADEPRPVSATSCYRRCVPKTLSAELDRVLAQGYVLVAGDPSADILVLENRPAAEQRKYLISDRLSTTIEKNEYNGYRMLPWSFSNSHNSFAAMLESLSEGEPQPEYKLSRDGFHAKSAKRCFGGICGRISRDRDGRA